MQRVLVIAVAVSLACVSTKRVTIAPGDPDGDRCLATCKTKPTNDEVVACAASCPGATSGDGECKRRVDAGGEDVEIVPGCVESTHVRWRRIATIAGFTAGVVVVVLGLLVVAFLSTPTH